MAYVYRHIRLDKNEPFYIGVGGDDFYKRSKEKYKRSKYWKSISKNGYNIQIIIDDITYDEALIKEAEFIKLYGRKDLGLGTLCNHNNGGVGFKGGVHSEESKRKISISTKNRNLDYNRILNIARNSENLKKYYISRRGKEWHKHTVDFKKYMSELKTGYKQSKTVIDTKSIKIVQLNLDNEIIKVWDSARQIQRETKLSQGNISRCCNGKYKQAYGFKWEYLKNK